MADLIDRDTAINALEELCDRVCEYGEKHRSVMCVSCPLGSAFDVLENLSTPQPDCIRRQAVIDSLHRRLRDGFDEDKWWNSTIVLSAINETPSAQPEITLESAIDYLHSIGWMQEHDKVLTESAQPERKTGRWQYVDYGGFGNWHCTACRKICICNGDFDYCPNCGAKMEDSDE